MPGLRRGSYSYKKTVGYKPDEKTIAFWKFDGDLTDATGNYNITSTQGSVNYDSLPGDSSIKCLRYKAGSNSDFEAYVDPSIWTSVGTQQTSFSLGMRIKFITIAQRQDFYMDGTNSRRVITIGYNNGDYSQSTPGLILGTGNTSQYYNVDQFDYTLNTGTRYDLWFTYDHTTREKKYYVNGNHVGTVTATRDYDVTNTGHHARAFRCAKNGEGWVSFALDNRQ